MVSIERLLERFGSKEYTPYGNCIAVPGTDWHEKWQSELKTMGYEYIRTDFGNPNRPVYLIKLKDQVPEAIKEPARGETPAVESKENYKRGRWSEKDKERLDKLMDSAEGSVEEKARAVLKEFPGRPLHSLLRQYLAHTNSSLSIPISRGPGEPTTESASSAATSITLLLRRKALKKEGGGVKAKRLNPLENQPKRA